MTRVIVASTLSFILILSIAGLGLAAPMLDPPFRIAQAAVQVGDFNLSDGSFGSLHAEAACCGSAPGHIGASASSTVDFGIFSGFVSVHVEDFQPPPQPFVDVFPRLASAGSDAHDVLTISAGSRLVLSLLVEGSATAEGLLGGLPGGRLLVAVHGPPQCLPYRRSTRALGGPS